MALANMQVYNHEIMTTTIELLGQKLEAFNAASRNALQLSTAQFRGNFSAASFFNQVASAQRRVDRTAAIGAQAATQLSQGEQKGVKVGGGFGPVAFEPGQMTWLLSSPQEAIMAISEGFANALLADQLNTSVGAAVAATENIAALVHDVSATTGITQQVLNKSHFKFGDRQGDLVCDIMHSSGAESLTDKALANGERLFVAGNVQVIEILSRVIVISDIPALYESGTPNKSKVLSIVVGGVVCDNASDIITNSETTNGNTRIETTFQADYSFGIQLLGYAWAGSASPLDAALFTGANWTKAVADNKHLLGTLAIGDADK